MAVLFYIRVLLLGFGYKVYLKEENKKNAMKDVDQSIDSMMIYLHSHGSNRQEGRFLLDLAYQKNYNLCLMDMRGSGESEGEFCTLGIKEYKDVYSLMVTLAQRYKTKEVILFGRSMGAASVMNFVKNFRTGIIFVNLKTRQFQ